MEEHKEYLEKPLIIDYNTLQEILLICNNIVKEINNFLFEKVLTRSASEDAYDWEWDLRKDKAEFKKYYDLFVSIKKSMSISAAAQGISIPHLSSTLGLISPIVPIFLLLYMISAHLPEIKRGSSASFKE